MRAKEIDVKKRILLMGLCGGKCEFRGCNSFITEDFLTSAKCNFGDYAHIIASSENGPRGDKILSRELSDDFSNIMVLCKKHHKEIDTYPEKFTRDMLRSMKFEHERYIKELLSIKKENTVVGVKYTFGISDRVPRITDNDVKVCAFKQDYYCIGDVINLSDSVADETDNNKIYDIEKENIKRNFLQMVKPQFKKENAQKLFLCAIAPQPLLIYLGTLFSDISNVEIQQLQREPVREWSWNQEYNGDFEIKVYFPEKKSDNVALNISITADIDEKRIRNVVGNDCDIVKVESTIHGNDIIKSKEQLSMYRKKIRDVYEKIKDVYGRDCTISMFPAMPVSVAVETGRCWMKKAHPRIIIFDEKDGFKEALKIQYREENS